MSEISDARLDAAAALRDLANAFVAHDVDDATLARIEASARTVLPEVARGARRERVSPEFGEIAAGVPPADAARRHAMADRAVAGPANPTAVEITSTRDGTDVVASVRFGKAFEGAPGRVHGGIVGAVFDDVTGYVLAFGGKPGFTGRLTVTYRAPVPIETTIEFRARLREETGRKLTVDGEARLGEKVLATADAMFVLVDPKHFATHAAELLARDSD